MNNQSFLNLSVHDGQGSDASEWSRNDAVTETFIYLHTCFCYYSNKAGISYSLETHYVTPSISHTIYRNSFQKFLSLCILKPVSRQQWFPQL
jgi:hypothetical protein